MFFLETNTGYNVFREILFFFLCINYATGNFINLIQSTTRREKV